MIDSILYGSPNLLSVEVINAGSVNSVLFTGDNGIHQNIELLHNGSVLNILYPDEVMEIIPKSNTYSRSRVVNQ